jgi:hypothetical protein
MLGSIVFIPITGAYSFQFGASATDQYQSKHFSVKEYGSSAKAKAAALAYQKEIQPKLEKLTIIKGKSRIDKIFNTNKKFRDFVSKIAKTDPNYKDFKWEEVKGNPKSVKAVLLQRFKNELKFPKTPGYDLASRDLAKALGLKENYFDKIGLAESKKSPRVRWINENFPKIKVLKEGLLLNYWKATPTKIAKFKKLFKGGLKDLKQDTVKRVLEIDDVFRKDIVVGGRLPDVLEVMTKTSANTPDKAASAMAVYSRVLRGEEFPQDLKIKPSETAGARLITQLGDTSQRNTYKTAFYRLALDKINKQFDKHGTLETFKRSFREELRAAMQLKKGVKVPYNINEVISISAGESRGVQPFSVFVDATAAKINQKNLASYQGVFSKKIAEVEGLIKENKLPEAKKAAETLKKTQEVAAKTLIKQGFTESQIKQLNFPEIVVDKKIDPNIYSPEKLARWKKSGLDIGQFVKEKGFYIDVKKAKPFWESNVKNTIIEAAKNNVGNVCNIFKGRIAYSADGGRIGFQGGCAGEMTAAMKTDATGTLQQINKTKGILPKFQNAATSFLGMLGRVGTKAAPLAALAVAGAAIEPAMKLVKQFRSDDPSTYLTDENQQKGMLIATIEGETPRVDEEILKWQYPGLGAATLAGAVPGAKTLFQERRGVGPRGPLPGGVGKTRAALGLRGVLGKALGATFSPLAVAATLPLGIAAQRKAGTEWGDIATDPSHWFGPAFAASGAEWASRGIKNPMLLKALRLGMKPSTLRMISSKFGIPGLMVTGGMWGYDKWKNRSINDE